MTTLLATMTNTVFTLYLVNASGQGKARVIERKDCVRFGACRCTHKRIDATAGVGPGPLGLGRCSFLFVIVKVTTLRRAEGVDFTLTPGPLPYLFSIEFVQIIVLEPTLPRIVVNLDKARWDKVFDGVHRGSERLTGSECTLNTITNCVLLSWCCQCQRLPILRQTTNGAHTFEVLCSICSAIKEFSNVLCGCVRVRHVMFRPRTRKGCAGRRSVGRDLTSRVGDCRQVVDLRT